MTRPFEVSADKLQHSIDPLVDSVIGNIQTDFLELPKGKNFVEPSDFVAAYEALHQGTQGFKEFTAARIWEAVCKNSLCFVVLRAILGLSPPEWADITFDNEGIAITQNQARGYDSSSRHDHNYIGKAALNQKTDLVDNIKAMIAASVTYLSGATPTTTPDKVHRRNLVDISEGITSLVRSASKGIRHEDYLYERLLGRPFATQRDSVSRVVGDALEDAVEAILVDARIPFFRDTNNRDTIEGFPQKPDFIVPSIEDAEIIIEAKIAKDDGTARDKVARIERLARSHGVLRSDGLPKLELIACVDGRGFGVRRNDIKALIHMTEGKLFTTADLDQLIQHTQLRKFVGKQGPPHP